MPAPEAPYYDIVFLGSGISCSLTLLPLLHNLTKKNIPPAPVRIAVVEKKDEFWKGFPYGDRSSVNGLTITTLGEFVPEPEKESFLQWLRDNLASWTKQLREKGGQAGQQWLENNLPFIEKNQWDDIYLPRHLFGAYVQEKVLAAIGDAAKKGIAEVTLLQAEATDINRKADGDYGVLLEMPSGETQAIDARTVILTIGSPPVRSIQIPGDAEKAAYLYINDPYLPGMEINVEAIRQKLATIEEPGGRNILIVGSNASSLELLYLLGHRNDIRALINQITVLSYSGLLPHRITPNNFPNYRFENLTLLLQNKNYNADILMQAIESDLDIAYKKGVNIGDTYYQMSDLVVELLDSLSWVEQKYFYGAYGMRFTKLIRRAGAEYRDMASELIRKKKLELVRGKFMRLERSEDDPDNVRFIYTDREKQYSIIHYLKFPIVVNCTGFEELPDSSSLLIRNLVEKRLCRVNSSNRGFDVNEDFEANTRLYIVGPLLGGIFNNKLRYWHVENAKRIYKAGSMLADIIVKP
ncbi:MAG TPA: FAD/NAD(P)-binding protein [Puia sp.]|nr:FAD/NAD(P)-binding protein [Puia sp.]